MSGPLGVFAALLIICLVSTTAEGRAAARVQVNRWTRWLWLPCLLFWSWVLIEWLMKRPP